MNIPAIARAALQTAWTAADSALVDATLRTGPTAAYDPATDATTTTWTAETTCRALLYNEQVERETAADPKAQQRTALALLRRADIEPAVPGLGDQVEIDGTVWQIMTVETPPADAIQILKLTR